MAAAPWVNFRRVSIRTPWWLVLAFLVPVAGFRLVRFTIRHRRALPGVTAAVLLLWAYARYGPLPLVLVGLAVVAGVWVWRWRWPASCRRLVLAPVLARWRRLWVYRRQWAESFALCGLHKSFDGTVLLPRLVAMRCKDATDEVVVRMLRGQSPDAYHKAAVNLAYSFGFRHCRVFSRRRDVAPFRAGRLAWVLRAVDRWRYRDRPRLVTLMFIRRDVLAGAVVAPLPVPRAGKGSVIRSLVRALAGGISSGLVRLWGIDPKGGMELAIGARLFARYEFADYQAMADLFDDAVAVMRRRQAALSGKVRVHTPTGDEPLYVIVIDELSALTAYLQDTALRARILQSLALLLSQGAGLARIALRLNEANHVNLALGDGARDRGALADQIPNDDAHKGIAYVGVDDQPEPARIRFSYNTDHDVRWLADTYPAKPEALPPRPAKLAASTDTAVRRHTYRPSSLTGGPLLPGGLLDALHRNDPDGEGDPA